MNTYYFSMMFTRMGKMEIEPMMSSCSYIYFALWPYGS